MTDWASNHALAEQLARTGWAFEDIVAADLRAAGIAVEQPPKEWRAVADATQALQGSYANEVDLTYRGMRLSVKSRNLLFSTPDDIPNNRNPLFIDTERKWAHKHPVPWAVICISQQTKAIIWLPVAATQAHWGTRQAYDRTRGYADQFMTADRSLWQPWVTLPTALRTAQDGYWLLGNARHNTMVQVHNGVVVNGGMHFTGRPFIDLVRFMRTESNFTSKRIEAPHEQT